MRIIEKHFAISGVTTLVSALVVYLFLKYADESSSGDAFPLLALIFLAGGLGGTTNHYRRLQLIPDKDEKLQALASWPSIVIQAVVSPALGGIFAVVAYLIFAAGLLKGPLFPEFKDMEMPYQRLKQFCEIGPKVQLDTAKLLVWAFLAGFSEKFVPNLLDRLAQDAEKSKDNPAKTEKPETPKNLVVSVGAPGSRTLRVNWDDAHRADNYRLKAKVKATGAQVFNEIVADSQGIIILPDLAAGTELDITVTARNATGESQPTASLTAMLP
jgi:hypothetical protein